MDALLNSKMVRDYLNWPKLGAFTGVNTDFSDADVWHPSYWIILAYIVCVPVMNRIYSNKDGTPCASKHQSFWKPIMIVYNALLSLFSFAIFIETVLFLQRTGAGNLLGQHNDCKLAFKDERFEKAVYVFFLSKYVEYADTVFLIVKGKGVSFLHYFHHVFAALSMGLTYRSSFEGAWMFLLLNGFVHGVMYFYYECSLLKIQLPGKKYITRMQITQFVVGLGILWFYKYVPCVQADASLSLTWCFFWFFLGMLILLFSNFYVQSFRRGGKNDAKKAKMM